MYIRQWIKCIFEIDIAVSVWKKRPAFWLNAQYLIHDTFFQISGDGLEEHCSISDALAGL